MLMATRKPEGGKRRTKKLPEFKILSAASYGNRERLGRALMRCIEYIESIGYNSEMSGGEEGRTCMDILLTGIRGYGFKKNSLVEVTIKPDMYAGSNADIIDLINTPTFGMHYDEFQYDIPSGSSVDSLLKADYSYYDLLADYGYRMPVTEALVKFFLLNKYADPEQNYCELPRMSTNVTEVSSSEKYSCLSDILDLSRNPYGEYQTPTGGAGRPEVLPDVIKIINTGAMCSSKGTRKPCLEKLIDMSVPYLDDTRGPDRQSVYKDHTFAYSIDKYDWSIKSSDGVPIIQKLINGSSMTFGGSSLTYLNKYLLAQADPSSRASFMKVLSDEYDFRNIMPYGSGFRFSSGHKRMTGVDYILSTGVMISDLAKSPLAEELFIDMPLCRYDDTDNMYSCFAKVISNVKLLHGESNVSEKLGISTNDYYDLINNAVANDMGARRMFKRGVVEGDCNILTGSPLNTMTCMDLFIDTVCHSTNPDISTMFSVISDAHQLTDMTCTDERNGGRIINCLDKFIGEVSSSPPLDTIRNRGVLLDLPDCTDANGGTITCIDKMMQRHELWVYVNYRRRQLLRIQKAMLKRMDEGESMKSVLMPLYHMTGQLLSELSEAALEMNITEVGFLDVASEYDLGSIRSHVPSFATPAFKKVIQDDIVTTQMFADLDLGPGITFTPDRSGYSRELMKSITDGTSRETPIVSRIMKLYDANAPYFADYSDYGNVGVTELLSQSRTDNLSLAVYECKDAYSGKTISCMQKLVDVSAELSVKRGRLNPSGYKNEYASLFSMRDMYSPTMCEAGGTKRSCLEYVFENLANGGVELDMSAYVAVMSSKGFSKYSDVVVKTKAYGDITMRDLVCKNVTLFDLADYMVKSKTMAAVGNSRPRLDHLAVSLHSMCNGCDKIKDPLDKRICYDADCFNEHGGFLADKDKRHTYVNEQNQDYGGYNYDGSKWANEYAKDPESAMSQFRYGAKEDLFGLAGVYTVTYDPSKSGISNIQSGKFDYPGVVMNTILPSMRRSVGKTLKRYKTLSDVKILDFDIDNSEEGNYKAIAKYEGVDGEGRRITEMVTSPIPDLFAKGGLLSSDYMKSMVIKRRGVMDAIRKISTMKSSNVTENTMTLVISNRPADFMRASTGQPWTSCMGFRQYPGNSSLNRSLLTKMNLGAYVAYAAGHELENGWKARMIMVPGMDFPNEPTDRGDVTNIFRVEEPYGLKSYTTVMQSALGIILRENGYNYPGSYSAGAHGDMSLESYIYNDPRAYGDKTRRGGTRGRFEGGSHGGTRRNMLMGEIWREATSKCLEKLLKGEAFTLGAGAEPFDAVEDCDYFRNRAIPKQGLYPEPTEEEVESMWAGGVLSKDLARNFRHTVGTTSDMSFFSGYDGVTNVDMIMKEISDAKLDVFKKHVTVTKVRPLATVRGRNNAVM